MIDSNLQKQASDSAKGLIQEAVIQNLDTEKILSISTTITIADLGCSVGPNTFFAVQYLIESVESKLSPSSKNLEFQVLFNDHAANDFNTLFTTLPPGRQYYAAGVPGSFYGRLFPANSITIAYSSYALHWLSKQPRGPPNKGRIHYIGAPEDVIKVYSDQFSRDLGVFMIARAEETVSGGLMFLIMPGIPEGLPHSDFPGGFLTNFLGSSLMELANEVN